MKITNHKRNKIEVGVIDQDKFNKMIQLQMRRVQIKQIPIQVFPVQLGDIDLTGLMKFSKIENIPYKLSMFSITH
jgi:hypothetical protein